MNEDEIRTILQDMPTSVYGFCFHDDDGTPFVVLNARQSLERQRKAYQHELEHIERGEMFNEDYHEYGRE